MGGNNVKGLYWMETIYPPENGVSVIPPEKLQKEIEKGTIPAKRVASEQLDADMDERIDQVIREVWAYYDPKGTGVIPKKVLEKFFKDSLDLYALRKGAKSSKEIIAPGVKMADAMAASVQKVTLSPQATFKDFENFLNCYDIDEALGAFLNISEVYVNNNVQMVDTQQMLEESSKPKIVYRDYSALQD